MPLALEVKALSVAKMPHYLPSLITMMRMSFGHLPPTVRLKGALCHTHPFTPSTLVIIISMKGDNEATGHPCPESRGLGERVWWNSFSVYTITGLLEY